MDPNPGSGLNQCGFETLAQSLFIQYIEYHCLCLLVRIGNPPPPIQDLGRIKLTHQALIDQIRIILTLFLDKKLPPL